MCFANFNLDLRTLKYLFQDHEKNVQSMLELQEKLFKDDIWKIKVFCITEATLVRREHFHNSADSNYGTWRY